MNPLNACRKRIPLTPPIKGVAMSWTKTKSVKNTVGQSYLDATTMSGWVSECVTSVFNITLINDTHTKYIRNRIVVGTYQDVFYFHLSTVEQNIVILCLLSLGLNKNVNVDAHWGWTVWSFIAHLSITGPHSSLTTPDWVTWEHIISADKEDLDSKEYKL